jgi:2-methylcitrate dehydratase PrpD
MIWALGNAANQACGIVETLPCMAKNLAVGSSARNGLMAAMLAERQFDGGQHPIEGTFGFANVMAEKPDISQITGGLGERWELSDIAYKPYPTGVVLHPVLQACLELRAENLLRPVDIDHVRVRGNPLLAERADRPMPLTGREGSLSVQHCCAIAFATGNAGLRQFTDAATTMPEVAALRAKVTVESDSSVGVEEAHVTVRDKSGKEFAKHIPHLPGSLQCPMSDAELEAKFTDQAAAGAPKCDTRALIDALWRMDELEDVGKIMPMMR